MITDDNNQPIQSNDPPHASTPRKHKIYLGNLETKERRSGDPFLCGYICRDDINSLPAEYVMTSIKDGKEYVKIIINPFQEGKNKHGNTHSIAVDTFKPDPEYVNNH